MASSIKKTIAFHVLEAQLTLNVKISTGGTIFNKIKGGNDKSKR